MASLPALHIFWTEAYPDDPMTEEDLIDIVDSARPFTTKITAFDTLKVLDDARKIGCYDLVNVIQTALCGNVIC
jgi:hypothetical protein